MGLVYAQILLTNGRDLDLALQHIIGQEEIKHISVNMLVDSGAYMMCINEGIQAVLNLPLLKKKDMPWLMELLLNLILSVRCS